MMPCMDRANPPIVLHRADGTLVLLEVDETDQLVETRVAPSGSKSVEVVPRLHCCL